MRVKYNNFIIDGKDKSGLSEEVSEDVGRRLLNAGLVTEVKPFEVTVVGDAERQFIDVPVEPRKTKKGK